MATDVSLLSAAREVAAAHEVVKVADAANVFAAHAAKVANDRVNEARLRLAAAEKRLVELSRQKPAEPAPKPEIATIPAGHLQVVPDKVATLVDLNEMHKPQSPRDKKQPRIGAGG